MTIYADAETRKVWRINYGIPDIKEARSSAEFWERRNGGAPSGCILALAHAMEQIDADEALLRQALDALDNHGSPWLGHDLVYLAAMDALRERLKC